ncbi:MAG: 50S ribosomal protein L6 [Clostridiales bacterium]|nr:50S ribosomal protein L6 [Clostridiales bacterium]
MSRIGRNPIELPAGVNVSVNGTLVSVTGPKGSLSREINPKIEVVVEGNTVKVLNNNTEAQYKAYHGLYRQLIANMVEGVSKGYEKTLNVNGVGFKITQQGKDLVLNIGFSHPVEVKAVEGITLSCDKSSIKVAGIDKELVGQFAAKIRAIKPVEPYHAYGISYADEVIVRKEVKSGKK